MVFSVWFDSYTAHEEIKYCDQVLNIKPVIDLYNSKGIEYPVGLDNNDHTFFENEKSRDSFIVLYVDVDFGNCQIMQSIKTFQFFRQCLID